MFEGKISREKFYEIFGGQRYRRIATPKNYPYIYLIDSELDKTGDGIDATKDTKHNRVLFSAEGAGEIKHGNKAIIEHRNRKGVYNSLLLFNLKDNEIEYVGEYVLQDIVYDDGGQKIDHFVLIRSECDLDDVSVFYVGERANYDSIDDKEFKHYLYEIGKRKDYFSKKIENNDKEEDHIRPILSKMIESHEYPEGLYVDENGEVIDESNSKGELKPTTKNEIQYDSGYSDNLSTNDKSNNTFKRIKVEQHKAILKHINKRIRRKMKKYAAKAENIEEAAYSDRGSYLYCVNVGCALAIFLVISRVSDNKKELWCFDCGVEKNSGDFRDNICDCLRYIKDKFFKEDEPLRIDKFFLSHPHYDHYNEIILDYLHNSEIWISSNVNTAPITYVNFVTMLEKQNEAFVSPICNNQSNSVITIHHPDKPIVFRGEKRNRKPSVYYTTNANNLSPLIELRIGDKNIFLPGDIEKDGWRIFLDNNKEIEFNDFSVSFHSHHGSKNGFLFDFFRPNYTEYEVIHSKIDFLSSREKAPSGIVSEKMKTHALYSSTIKTYEDEIAFYELSLETLALEKR